MATKEKKGIGGAAVDFCGQAIFLTMDGGTFTHNGIEGTFAGTVGGSSMILYIGDVAYQCGIEGVIEAAVKHYKTLPESKKKADGV